MANLFSKKFWKQYKNVVNKIKLKIKILKIKNLKFHKKNNLKQRI